MRDPDFDLPRWMRWWFIVTAACAFCWLGVIAGAVWALIRAVGR